MLNLFELFKGMSFFSSIKNIKNTYMGTIFLYVFEFQIWINLQILLILQYNIQYYSFVIIQKHYL